MKSRNTFIEIHLFWWRWQDWTGECYDSFFRPWDGWVARGPILLFWKAGKP